MRGRWTIIGAQAATVALLVLIVYVTLLRPESTDPLRGIETPGSDQRADAPPHEDGGSGHGGGGGANGGGAGASGAGAIGVHGGVETTGTPVARLTPRGDQYSDSVSELLTKVAAADPAAGSGAAPAGN
jgi:hypothetical protein